MRHTHVKDIARGVRSLGNGPVLDPALGLDLWQYRVYSEVPYVDNLLAIPQETLDTWSGSFMVHADAICWNRATIPAQFRYVNQLDSDYWCEQQRWERRVLSSLGRFIPFHFCCAYNMTEVARDRLLARIPASYSELEVPQGFLFEQEPLFSYCARALIDDEQSGLWVVAYTERVVRICSALLMTAYSQYRLWYCLLYTSPSPRDQRGSRMPSSA